MLLFVGCYNAGINLFGCLINAFEVVGDCAQAVFTGWC